MTTSPPISPPALRDQRKIDLGHLKLLSVFHFVGAGLAVAGLLFLLLHFAVMNAMFANPEFWQSEGQAPPPPAMFEMFELFRWFYLLFGLWFVASAVLNLLSGMALRAKRKRSFSLVVAGLNCLHMPLGTILGVFTFVVLLRESVRELYRE